jgi:hypothetical protein
MQEIGIRLVRAPGEPPEHDPGFQKELRTEFASLQRSRPISRFRSVVVANASKRAPIQRGFPSAFNFALTIERFVRPVRIPLGELYSHFG